ncbi:LPS translocon maturation chaperone LptM [Halomonas salipaludis]|uniref:Lipopeptide n=1 Tax=Halomonas salipaludis TaxID=2032625 RepID=A0A2A2EVV6_9GAMM|nr:lipoprotein [Halomonas salipaludis]PAU77551.1 lipopeptide [Halomonas salipaludis]
MIARAALLALALLLLAGCGQKGPLYLPDDQQAAERYGVPDTSDDDES